MKNHYLVNEERPAERSKLLSDGRYLFVYSCLGEIKLEDSKIEDNLYCGKNLYGIDIFDPLDNFKQVISFPITDPNNILDKYLNILDETLKYDIITDGRVIQFYVSSKIITYNIIKKEITEIAKTNELSQFKICYDGVNNLLWVVSSVSRNNIYYTNIKYAKAQSNNRYPSKTFMGNERFKCLETFNLIENFNKAENQSESVKENFDNDVFDYFVKTNALSLSISSFDENKKVNHYKIISFVLKGLSIHSNRTLNYKRLESNVINHLFNNYSMNLNANTIKTLVDLFESFYSEFETNSKIEIDLFIISSFVKLLKAHLTQINMLKFNKIHNFDNQFSDLKRVLLICNKLFAEIFSSNDLHKRFTLDLIVETYEILLEFSNIYDNLSFPNLKLYNDILTKNKYYYIDMKDFIINFITNRNDVEIKPDYYKEIILLIENVYERNNSQIIGYLKKIIEELDFKQHFDKVEFSNNIEVFLNPILKSVFNDYCNFIEEKNENEKSKKLILFKNNFDGLFKIVQFTNKKFIELIKNVFSFLHLLRSQKNIDEIIIIQKINFIIINYSYSFRFFYTFISFISSLSQDKWILFKTWHIYYEILIYFDNELSKINSMNDNLNPQNMYLFESSHPIEKNIKLSKVLKFDNAQNISIEFDELSCLDATSTLNIIYLSDGYKEIKYINNSFQGSYLENVTEVIFNLSTSSTIDHYGVKLRLINKKSQNIYFLNEVYNQLISLILGVIKSFFFLNEQSGPLYEREIEDILQSKLFSGGIMRLLDLENSSKDYKLFSSLLQESNSPNKFMKRLSCDLDQNEEEEEDEFSFNEFMESTNQIIGKITGYFQKSLRIKYPWINLGGTNADKIVKAIFAIVIKHERLWETLKDMYDSILSIENESEEKIFQHEICTLENYDYFILIWSEVSKIRQWYNEQIKDLAELNHEDFDKQNEDFVEEVIEKCRFLFTINPSIKRKKNFSKSRLQILERAEETAITGHYIYEDTKNHSNALIRNHSKNSTVTDLKNIKKIVHSIINCLKLKKISKACLNTALKEINTKAKFREIGLSLIISLSNELAIEDTKHYFFKQIIVNFRKIYGNKIVSIEDGIKSASQSILNRINNRFEVFLTIIFNNINNSTSIFYLSDYMDCLIWNLSSRNLRFIYDISLIKEIFLNSKNELISNVWKNLINNKINFYSKISFLHKFNYSNLGHYLLEFFQIISNMIVGRIIQESEGKFLFKLDHISDDFNEFFRVKSTLNAQDEAKELVSLIVYIITEKIKEFVEIFTKINENKEDDLKSQEDQTKEIDDSFLNGFLNTLYKFAINQSNLLILQIKQADLIADLLVLLRHSSPINKFIISNILNVIFKNLNTDELSDILRHFSKRKIIGNMLKSLPYDEKCPCKTIIFFFLFLIYDNRNPIIDKSQCNSTAAFETSYYIIDLLKSLYNNLMWKSVFDEIIIDNIVNYESNKSNLIIPILCFMNGDYSDLHYGSFVSIEIKKDIPKTFYTRFVENENESINSMKGYIIGFCSKEIKFKDIKNEKIFRNYLKNDIKYNRNESCSWAVIAVLNKFSFSKSMLRNNDLDMISMPIESLTLENTRNVSITNEKIITLLTDIIAKSIKEKEYDSNILFDNYIFSLLLKAYGSIIKNDKTNCIESLINIVGLDQLIKIVSDYTTNHFQCLKSNRNIFSNQLKSFIDQKSKLSFNFQSKFEVIDRKIYISYEKVHRKHCISFSSGMNKCKSWFITILNSNVKIPSDSVSNINQLILINISDMKNTILKKNALFVDLSRYSWNDLNNLQILNIILLFPKSFIKDVTENKIHHPYFVLDCKSDFFYDIIANKEISIVEKSTYRLPSYISTIHYKKKEESDLSSNTELNVNDIVSFQKDYINRKPTNITQSGMYCLLRKIIIGQMRYLVMSYLSVKNETLNEINYDLLWNIFKISFFDFSQQINYFNYDYRKVDFIKKLFLVFFKFPLNKNKFTIAAIHNSINIFNSYDLLLKENYVISNIQAEICEFNLDNILAIFKASLNENLLEDMLKYLIKITFITYKDTITFCSLSIKFISYLNIYKSLVTKKFLTKDRVSNFLNELGEKGLADLMKINSISGNRQNEINKKMKILADFVYSVNKKLDKLSKNKLLFKGDLMDFKKILQIFKLINQKTRNNIIRRKLFYSDPSFDNDFNKIMEIAYLEYNFQVNLDFSKMHKYTITPLETYSKGKVFLSMIKENNKFKIVDAVLDNNRQKSLILTKNHDFTVIDLESVFTLLKVCGTNTSSKLGVDSLRDEETIKIFKDASINKGIKIKKVTGSSNITLVLTEDNMIFSCGKYQYAGFNLSKNYTPINQWNKIAEQETVIDIIGGEYFAIIMLTDKAIYASGINSSGLLGDIVPLDSKTENLTKIEVPFKISKVKEISIGRSHVLYLLDDGSVWGSGCNLCYELNLDIKKSSNTIRKISFPGDLFCEKISCGSHTSLFIMREHDGRRKLYSCGKSESGQSGQGINPDGKFRICSVDDNNTFRWCKIRNSCSIAITIDNQLFTWGNNQFGVLGHGDITNKYTPTKVDFFSNKQVLEADIVQSNMVVKCLVKDSIKYYITGDYTKGTIGIEYLTKNVQIPIELPNTENVIRLNFNPSGGALYAIKFIVEELGKFFYYKCGVCKLVSNEICYYVKREKGIIILCQDCVLYSKEKIFYATYNLNIFCSFKTMKFPDIILKDDENTNEETDVIEAKCIDCSTNIDKIIFVINYIDSYVLLCKNCLKTSSRLENPKIIYAVTKPMRYDSLPVINSHSILGIHKTSLLIKLKLDINSKGLKDLNLKYNDKYLSTKKLYNLLTNEHLQQYIKVLDIEAVHKDRSLIQRELKRSPLLGNLLKNQVDLLDLTANMLNSAMQILRKYVDIDLNNKLKHLFVNSLSYLSSRFLNDLFENLLYFNITDLSPSNYMIRVNRGKTSKFKAKSKVVDTTFSYTIFSQIIKEIRRLNFPITQFKGKKNQRFFKVELVGEGATDAGGPFREVLNNACEELQSNYIDLFVPTSNNRSSSGTDREKWTINPSANSSLHLEIFKYLGKIFAWAIRSTNFLNLDLPSLIWKQILNLPLDINDLDRIDVHNTNFLKDLFNLDIKGISKDNFDYHFNNHNFTTLLSNGKEVELCIEGKNKLLTFENRKEYFDLVLKARFDECSLQVQAIRQGLL